MPTRSADRDTASAPANADDAAPVDKHEVTDEHESRLTRRLALSSVVIAVLPVVTAAVRAIHNKWVPIGDNAYFEFRSRDVFSHHFPFLGTWTSASQTTGVDLNNPGPLFFDLLAIPVKLFNHNGVVIGIMVINVAAIVGIAVVARRRGGWQMVAAAMLMCAALGWTMGSELLFEPWQPHAMLFPFLCFMVLTWSLACGDYMLLPWTVAVASLVLQTHLSYAELVPLLSLWGVGTLAWIFWRRRRDDQERWHRERRRVGRVALISGVVFVVLWAPAFIEEVRHGSDGNLSLLVSTIGKSKDTIGVSLGTKAIAEALSMPPWWLRGSFGDAYVARGGARLPVELQHEILPSVAATIISLAIVGAIVAAAWFVARRGRDRTAASAVTLSAVAIAGAWLTAITLPKGPLGIAPHQFRFLWPIAIFTTFAVMITLTRNVRVSHPVRLTGAFAAVALVLAVWNVPKYNQHSGPSADEESIAPVRDILSQLGSLDGTHTLWMDLRFLRFAEPWDAPILSELDRRGHEVVVDDPGAIRQDGPSRAFDGRADGRLLIVEGVDALKERPGATRVALHVDLSEAEQQELAELRDKLSVYLAAHPIELTAAGRKADGQSRLPELSDDDPTKVLDGDALRTLMVAGWVEVPDEVKEDFQRYAALQHRLNFLTVGLFLTSVEAGT